MGSNVAPEFSRRRKSRVRSLHARGEGEALKSRYTEEQVAYSR